MKTKFVICILIALPFKLFSQDTVRANTKKIFFSIQLGTYYKPFLGSNYIEPTQYNTGDEFTNHQYERFNKIPTLGFNTGLFFTYKFNNKWGITSGLIYFLRKDIFESNQDTIIKYGNVSSMRDIHNVLKYNYSFNNLEMLLMLRYSVKKITFYTGCYFSLLAYKKSTYTYVINQLPQNPQWTTSDKTITGFEMPLKIFPTVQVSYEVKIKNIKLNPYMAFYYAIKNQNDFYIQLGINLPIVLKNLPKLDRIPHKLKEKVFLKLFEVAEIAKLKPEEYKRYEKSVNAYRDIFNIQNTAFEKGEVKKQIEIAKNMISKGMEIAIISEITGLTENEIKALE